jgi:hypothetical protein
LSFLQYKLSDYRQEKEKLQKQIDDSKDEKMQYCEKLENEIKNYKNMTNSCIKTCSQLADEILGLKKSIEQCKMQSSNQSFYSLPAGNFGNYSHGKYNIVRNPTSKLERRRNYDRTSISPELNLRRKK